MCSYQARKCFNRLHLGGVANLAASYDLSAAYWASLYQQATQVDQLDHCMAWWVHILLKNTI